MEASKGPKIWMESAAKIIRLKAFDWSFKRGLLLSTHVKSCTRSKGMLGAPVIRSKERWFPSATASTLSIPPPANPDFCTGCFSLVSKVGPVFGGLNYYWCPSIVDRDNDFGGLLNKGFINYSFYNTLQSSMIFVSINDLGKPSLNPNTQKRTVKKHPVCCITNLL